jgi:hypothetical protein
METEAEGDAMTLTEVGHTGIRGPDVSRGAVRSHMFLDGRIIYYRHHRSVCGICGVNYSWDDPKSMDIFAGHVDVRDTFFKRRGYGRVLPIRPEPPSSLQLFTMFYGWQKYETSAQYVHVDDLTWGLIFTAGASLDSKQADPRAGWAFVANPPELEGLATRMAMSKAVSRNTF